MVSSARKTVLIVLALVLANVLSAWVYTRVDLTADGRYTLTEGTRNLLQNLPTPVQVDVFLTGQLPPGFRRLETAVQETLDEFEAVAGNTLQFRFVDPLSGTLSEQQTRLAGLAKLGLQPTNLFASQNGTRTEQLIMPGAVVRAGGRETGVLLLKGNKAASPAEQLNQSYEGVEYQLATAIRGLTQPVGSRRRVGMVFGHTQVPPARFSDLLASIQQEYDLFFVDLTKPGPVEGLDALLVLKPDQPFSEEAVFKLDQYVVNGGRALFAVDGHRIDSVGAEGTYAQPLPLGLDDLFFTWGARLNQTVVKDLTCGQIPLAVGTLGNKPNVQLVPWRFYPVLNAFGNSPICRNLDAVATRFLSTIDTVRAKGIRKTVLLETSPYTTILKLPALISYSEARQQPDPATYTGGTQTAAILLEGAFTSRYVNLLLPDSLAGQLKKTGKPGKVVLMADGDLVVNDIDPATKRPLPLGYDRYTRTQFANKELVLNALDHLTDPAGVIMARNREVPLRPLDAVKVAGERTWWQALNLLGPLALLAVGGLLGQVLRRRQYGKNPLARRV